MGRADRADPYLSKHRGEYVQRGAVFLPLVHRLDFGITQDVFTNIGGERHRFQFRVDIINFGNMLNSDWGVAQRLVSNQPLTNPAADAQGRATYRLRVISGQLMNKTLEQTADLNNVYRVMFSLSLSSGRRSALPARSWRATARQTQGRVFLVTERSAKWRTSFV